MTSETDSNGTILGLDLVIDSIGDLISDIASFEGDVVDLGELLESLDPGSNFVDDTLAPEVELAEGPPALVIDQSDPGDVVDLQHVLSLIVNDSNTVLLDTSDSWIEIPISII